MLQRDLWAVFDWSVQQFPARDRPPYTREKQELQARLAEVLRRLALTPEELKSLPDNYSQAAASGAFAKEYDPSNRQRPFLPPDLFDPRGPWVCIRQIPESDSGVAKTHSWNVRTGAASSSSVKLPKGARPQWTISSRCGTFLNRGFRANLRCRSDTQEPQPTFLSGRNRSCAGSSHDTVRQWRQSDGVLP